MSFMANWNYETFVQLSLDNNFIRPFVFILDYLLDHTDDAQFKHVLIHDFPQLISQDQVDISSFLNQFVPSINFESADDDE